MGEAERLDAVPAVWDLEVMIEDLAKRKRPKPYGG